MEAKCPVANFVRSQIRLLGKTQKEIADEVGFDKPNVITMIKQGKTKLPMAKIGRMAMALETDPVHLMKLCMSTYHPETWQSIEPYMESALTHDEAVLIHAWRRYVGMPYIAALSQPSKDLFRRFLDSLRTHPTVQ